MMAVASIKQCARSQGPASLNDIDIALRKVEASVTGNERTYEDMSAANRDAICFPIRLQQVANNAQVRTMPPLSEFGKWLDRPRF